MANRTVTLEDSGLLDTPGNWADDTKAGDGDTIVLNATLNAPNGYADGNPLTGAFTDDADAIGFSLSLAGAADLLLTDILGDLGNQDVVDVTLVEASVLDYDATEEILGNIALNASTMAVTANAAIGGTVDLVASTYTHASTGAITGAVTMDSDSTYNAGASHTLTGGITVTGGDMNLAGFTVTSDVVLEGGNLDIADGSIVGAVTATDSPNTIDLGTGGTIVGAVDIDIELCTWIGTGTFTADTTSDLVLGGVAVGMNIIIDDGAGTQTITVTLNLSCKSLTVTQGTYVAAVTHTLADDQAIIVDGTCVLQLTDVGVDVELDAAGETCTPGAALSCRTFIMTAGTWANEANAMTLAGGFIYTGGTLTITGIIKFTGTGAIFDMPALVTTPLEIDTTGEITVAGNLSVKTLTLTAGDVAFGASTITVAGDVLHTAGTITGTGLLKINTTANLKLIAPTIPITLDSAAITITATGPVSCSLFTMSSAGGTYAAGAQDHTFSAGFLQTAGLITATGTWTITGTGPLTITDAIVTLDVVVDAAGGTITVGAPLSLEGLTISDCETYVAGAHNHTFAQDCVHTGGTVTGTGDWKLTGAGNLALVCATIPLEIDSAGETVVTGPVSVKTLTLTAGTLTGGVQPITVAGSILQSAGTITSAGVWTVTATSTITITSAMIGAYFNITGGTATLTNALSIAGLQIQAGATFDADSNSLALAVGRITGYGTLTNLTPAGIIHVAPGVIDGGGNDGNVIFDPAQKMVTV